MLIATLTKTTDCYREDILRWLFLGPHKNRKIDIVVGSESLN